MAGRDQGSRFGNSFYRRVDATPEAAARAAERLDARTQLSQSLSAIGVDHVVTGGASSFRLLWRVAGAPAIHLDWTLETSDAGEGSALVGVKVDVDAAGRAWSSLGPLVAAHANRMLRAVAALVDGGEDEVVPARTPLRAHVLFAAA